MFTLLAAFSSYITLYTISANQVANMWSYYSGGQSYWRCSGAETPTFLPWPSDPRGVFLPVITEMNASDEFIYLYLIKTGLLFLFCLLMWAITIVYFFKAVLPKVKAWKRQI